MIYDDGARVFGASGSLAPFFEGMYEGKEIVVIGILISLSQSESLKVVGARMEIPIAIFLHQHGIQGHKKDISHEVEEKVSVRISEDRTPEKGILELLEWGLVIWKPKPSHILLH